MKKRLKSAARRVTDVRKSTLFSWRWREAFVGLAFLGVVSLLGMPAHAVSISGVSFDSTNITFEKDGIPNGTTVHFTIDTPGQVQISIGKVQNFGDTPIQVALLSQNYGAGSVNVSTSIFWNGLWLLDGDQARVDGNYQFTLTLSTSAGTSTVTPNTLVVLNSVDIHSVQVAPSLDTSGNPTFPFLIGYSLAKDANVTVNVLNSSGTLVKTILNNKPQFSELVSSHTLAWDGLAADGTSAPIGPYSVTIDAKDPTNGANAIQRVRPLTLTSLAGAGLSPQKLFENSIYVKPNPIRDGQGTFVYTGIRDGADIHLRIYTLTGILVLDKDLGSPPTGVPEAFVWNADNQSGNKVGRGLYYYVMRETDPQGTLQVTNKLAVIK